MRLHVGRDRAVCDGESLPLARDARPDVLDCTIRWGAAGFRHALLVSSTLVGAVCGGRWFGRACGRERDGRGVSDEMRVSSGTCGEWRC